MKILVKSLTVLIIMCCLIIKITVAQVNCAVGNDQEPYPGEEIIEQDSTQCPTSECLCEEGQKVKELEDGTQLCVRVIRPIDPNEIVGPEGFGVNRWVAKNAVLDYIIYFENDPEFATASARDVIITHPFDPHVRQNSMDLADYSFGPSYVYSIPANRSYYNTRHDVSDSLGVAVDLSIGINTNNTVSWNFFSVDPLTGLEPRMAESGFLPVNVDSTGVGEGFVSFSVQPANDATSQDTIKANARIVFDENDPIQTNTVFNIVDAHPPTSTIAIADTMANRVTLDITGNDNHSGIRLIEFYAAPKDSFLVLMDTLLQDSVGYEFTLPAMDTTNYCFLSVATDNVGNFEGWIRMDQTCTDRNADNGDDDDDDDDDDGDDGDDDDDDDDDDDEVTGVEDLEEVALLYPNPTDGRITITLNKNLLSGSIKVANTNGELLMEKEISPSQREYKLDLYSLQSGVYIVYIFTEEDTYVRQVVKE